MITALDLFVGMVVNLAQVAAIIGVAFLLGGLIRLAQIVRDAIVGEFKKDTQS